MSINFKNLETTLREISADISLPITSLVDLFIKSVVEYLSIASGLALDMVFDKTNYVGDFYVVRRITEDGIGFGEISSKVIKEYIQNNPDSDLFEYDSLDELSFVRQKIKSVSFQDDTGFFSRNDIIKINADFKQKITELAKDKEYNFFINKEGEMISGTVARVESENLILNLGFGEGFLSKYEMMSGDFFPIGSTVQAYICEVKPDLYKYQIKLSRTKPEFLGCLMTSIIPEIENGLIEIKGIARDPGSRAKVAVYADEYSGIDPVGSCIGRDGIRIKSIRSVLGNERIDIIKWDKDIYTYISNAIGMRIIKAVVHDNSVYEVIVQNDAVDSLGKLRNNKQQLKLISRLLKKRIRLTSIEEDQARVKQEKDDSEQSFAQVGLSEAEMKKLFENDISSLDDLVTIPAETLASLLGKDLEEAKVLISKTEESINKAIEDNYAATGIDYELVNVPYLEGMSPDFFKQHKIYTKQNLAEMDSEEVQRLFEGYLSEDIAVEDQQCEDIVIWSRGIRESK